MFQRRIMGSSPPVAIVLPSREITPQVKQLLCPRRNLDLDGLSRSQNHNLPSQPALTSVFPSAKESAGARIVWPRNSCRSRPSFASHKRMGPYRLELARVLASGDNASC